MILALVSCGDDGAEPATTVSGPGFTFSAPPDWRVRVQRRSASARPEGEATELVSVSVFRLARPYRPSLWPTVEPELDRVAADLAEQLGGRIVASATVVVDGRRAKRFDIAYARGGTEIVERTAFVLEGRRELQLICRYASGDGADGRDACALLFSSFRLV